MTHIIYRIIDIDLHLNGKGTLKIHRREGLFFTEEEPKVMYRYFSTMPALRLFLRDVKAGDIIHDAYKFKGGKMWISYWDIENKDSSFRDSYWIKPEHYTGGEFSAIVKIEDDVRDNDIHLYQLKEFPALKVAQFFKDHGFDNCPFLKF